MAWDEIVYEYDGSYHGFLCCIYESYMNKEFPIAFYGDEECFSLYPVRSVITDRSHARRVQQSIVQRSAAAAELLQRAFLTCMEDKEIHLYRFVRKLYKSGPAFLRNRADEACYPLAKAVRAMNGELEKLRGFVRFSDYQGVLGSEIEPKNQVLPLLRSHFCSRYANESFFIYDRTHRQILLYAKGRSRIFPVDELHLALPDEGEIQYRRLWKCFYETVSIAERTNPRCQNTHLPKRYRGTMTEFLPDDFEARRQRALTPPASPAAPAVPGAPAGRSVPETLRSPGPSAAASAP